MILIDLTMKFSSDPLINVIFFIFGQFEIVIFSKPTNVILDTVKSFTIVIDALSNFELVIDIFEIFEFAIVISLFQIDNNSILFNDEPLKLHDLKLLQFCTIILLFGELIF